MTCSVCIATYKRNELLKKLLDSLLRMAIPADLDLQIIVVDNDNEKSAKNILDLYSDTDRIEFEYYSQPKKNISITRNVAVKHSKGEYLLFIDDDEWADENLLSEHFKIHKEYNADGTFGIVKPEFHSDTPDWIKSGDYFFKDTTKTGDVALSTRTSNCLLKRSVLNGTIEPFNEEYGLTGGEDTFLFESLRKKGANFISVRSAIVYETISPERTNLKWLFKKFYQTGNTVTRRFIHLSKNKFFSRIYYFFRAFVFLIVSCLLMCLYCFNSKKRTFYILKIASNLGHIASVVGFNFEGYK